MTDAKSLLKGPAGPPPPGTNLVLSNGEAPTTLWTIAVSLSLATSGTCIILHYYSRLFITRKFNLADCFLLLGFLLFLALVVLGRVALNYGATLHMWDIELKTFFSLLYWFNTFQLVYDPCIFFVKAAILLGYVKIFAPSRPFNKFMYYEAWGSMVFNFCFYFASFMATIFRCVPREKIWNKLLPGGHCVSNEWYIPSSGMINTVSDFLTLVLPAKALWNLQIPTKQKFRVLALFGTGILASAASIGRIYFGFRAFVNYAPKAQDISYHLAFEALCVYAEISLGITVACMLSLPRLIRRTGKELVSHVSNARLAVSRRWGKISAEPSSDPVKRTPAYESQERFIECDSSDFHVELSRIHVRVDIEQTVDDTNHTGDDVQSSAWANKDAWERCEHWPSTAKLTAVQSAPCHH
ncbi:hypothetical protein K491DRAFT_680306 [Lophiostoma macrostomum CBS 122681]|uniref:Rhodopsin domain-containing protein n=1 Tax=Lophiostoma macrostomum CBS 122681 TaxID=1314788 RepID=A0A6A6T184_9PLEO|nr:hypothetical protein K491DRAFT_680306 [Lophiostoma macrostomum CBS 122681]